LVTNSDNEGAEVRVTHKPWAISYKITTTVRNQNIAAVTRHLEIAELVIFYDSLKQSHYRL